MSQQINLLNPNLRRRPFSLTSLPAMAWAIGFAVTACAALAVYENHRLRGLEAEAARVAQRIKESGIVASRAGTVPRKPSVELEARLRELEAQLKTRQDVVDALRRGLVGTSVGFSEYMRVFSRQSLQGVWLTGFDIAAGGEELTLAGRATSADLVPTYLQRLNRETPIQGRQFASMLINQPSVPVQTGKAAETERGTPAQIEFVISSMGGGDDRTRSAAWGQSTVPSLALRTPIEEAVRTPAGAAR